MWDWITANANPIMATTSILALAGGVGAWFKGLWGNRKPTSKNTAKSGGVVVDGNVKGDISTNPSQKRKK